MSQSDIERYASAVAAGDFSSATKFATALIQSNGPSATLLWYVSIASILIYTPTNFGIILYVTNLENDRKCIKLQNVSFLAFMLMCYLVIEQQ